MPIFIKCAHLCMSVHTCACTCVIWDSPLCTVNMLYYPWLIKELFWPMAGQNRVRQENKTECKEKEGGVRETPCSC